MGKGNTFGIINQSMLDSLKMDNDKVQESGSPTTSMEIFTQALIQKIKKKVKEDMNGITDVCMKEGFKKI